MKIKIVILVLFGLGVAGVLFFRDNPTDDNQAFAGRVGQSAPDFSLQSYDGKTYKLSELRGKKVVLFFNEGLMCYPACWNQMAALGTDEKLNNDDVKTISIVADTKNGWDEAIKRMPDLGKGTVLLDSDKTVSRTYRVLDLPSSMHKGMLPGHTYIILDKDGIIRYVYDDPKMGIQNDMLMQELSKI